MSERTILRGRAWAAGLIHDDVIVVLEDGIFADVRLVARYDDPEPNIGDGVMMPGFIDVHVHGGAGRDFMDGSEEAAHEVAQFHLRQGTTALAATTLSGSREAIGRALSAAAAVARTNPLDAAEIVAVHLEGPYLSREKKGAQDAASLRPADPAEVLWWRGLAPDLRWIMTVAPEIEGVVSLIEAFHDDICFSLGHTSATYAECVAAFESGATHVTHLFNAMPPLHHRQPGLVGAAMVNPHVTVELIADGIHLHAALLHMIASLLPDRATLVTDAMRACGRADGTFRLYDYDVTVAEGAARLADGTLAGSILTMREAVRNMVELAGLPLEIVLPLATEVPARILGLARRKGRIAGGFDADLLVLTPRFELARVFRGGVEVKDLKS